MSLFWYLFLYDYNIGSYRVNDINLVGDSTREYVLSDLFMDDSSSVSTEIESQNGALVTTKTSESLIARPTMIQSSFATTFHIVQRCSISLLWQMGVIQMHTKKTIVLFCCLFNVVVIPIVKRWLSAITLSWDLGRQVKICKWVERKQRSSNSDTLVKCVY